jgi:large subunit ribosomal protein L3
MTIFGKKVSMTHIEQDYKVMPVTVLDITENIFVKKSADGTVTIGWGKAKNPTKAEQGQYKDAGVVPVKVKEVGKEVEATVSEKPALDSIPETVEVTGISKGKGFAGVVKRYRFGGGRKTHGQSDNLRAPGSIGAGTTPGRVFKGTRMAGRMGSDRITLKKVQVVKVMDLEDKKYLLVKGPIPGPNGSLVYISW